jgi:HlyD family secretion protein
MNQVQTVLHSSVSNTGFGKSDNKVATNYVRLGYVIILLFFGSVGAWIGYVPVSSAAIAPGLLGKDGNRKTVQHLEGGIIHKILINDGDKVEANQELIILKNIQSGADFNLLTKHKIIALTREASLLAESRNQEEFAPVMPANVSLEELNKSVRDAVEGQVSAFYIRRKLYLEHLNNIDLHMHQAGVIIKALENQMRALNKKGTIIAEEQVEYFEFEKQGLVTREQVFRLKRDIASNETEMMTNRYAIESKRQEINNLNLEKLKLEATNTRRIVSDLDTVRNQLVDLDEKLAKTKDRLERTVIHAPIEGVIVDLRVNTIGGIIKPGEPLLDIVPDAGSLIIEAQIDPKDRDTVKIGQVAQVRFTAFNQRTTQSIKGKVVLISADRLLGTGPDGKQFPYYKAKVELLEDPAEVMNGAPVYQGMQAEVMIITGERTVLEYFLKPIVKSFNYAFRDD